MQYNVIYTAMSTLPNDLATVKEIVRNTFGSGQDLFVTIVNENGTAVDCSSVTTYEKIYIGSGATKIVDGGDLTTVDASAGTFKYPITATDFNDESTDVGTWDVEVILGDNATYGSQTLRIVAGGATLKVVDHIMD